VVVVDPEPVVNDDDDAPAAAPADDLVVDTNIKNTSAHETKSLSEEGRATPSQ